MGKSLRSRLALAAAALSLSSVGLAQSPEFHHLQGGFVVWPWVWTDPSSSHYRVWTAEDGGRIRFFDSNVGSWVFQPTTTHKNVYRHIFMLANGQIGLAVGDHGQWAWTGAGGTPNGSWHDVAPIEFPNAGNYPDFTMCHVQGVDLSNLTMWVVGHDGVLASTNSVTGSGLQQNSFTAMDPVTNDINLFAIDFVDDTLTGAASGQNIIYYTVDGATWSPAALHFLNPTTGQPASPPSGSIDFWTVAFVPGQTVGYAVGGIENGHGYFFRTLDSGQNWYQEFHECAGLVPCQAPVPCNFPPQPCPPGPAPTGNNVYSSPTTIYGVAAFPDGSALAAGYGGIMLRRGPTTSPSTRWAEVTDLCNFHSGLLWGVAADDDQTAWVGGMFNTIRRTNDLGTTWTDEGWDKNWRLREVAFVSGGGMATGDVGWASGQQMRIAKTTDGGVTWFEQRAHSKPFTPNFGKSIIALAFYDDGNASEADDNGVAVGDVWVDTSPDPDVDMWGIFYTNDGGDNCGWQNATVNGTVPMAFLNDAAFAGRNGSNQSEFWAVGQADTVLRSTDGGASWAAAGPPGVSGVTWRSVSFKNLDMGFVVGDDGGTSGKAYVVNNASTNPVWSDATPVAGCRSLKAVHVVGSNAYAAGSQGTVLNYNRITGRFEAVSLGASATSTELSSVAVVATPTGHEVFVGGADGIMLHFNGNAWPQPKSHTSSDLSSLSFLSATLGYGCGKVNGTVGGQTTLIKYE